MTMITMMITTTMRAQSGAHLLTDDCAKHDDDNKDGDDDRDGHDDDNDNKECDDDDNDEGARSLVHVSPLMAASKKLPLRLKCSPSLHHCEDDFDDDDGGDDDGDDNDDGEDDKGEV